MKPFSSFDSSTSSIHDRPPGIDLDNLGGRLHDSLTLLNRPGRPYVIKSDLTIMPGVTLTIEPGTVLEFYPSVGILVLGTLEAQVQLLRVIFVHFPVKSVKRFVRFFELAQFGTRVSSFWYMS